MVSPEHKSSRIHPSLVFKDTAGDWSGLIQLVRSNGTPAGFVAREQYLIGSRRLMYCFHRFVTLAHQEEPFKLDQRRIKCAFETRLIAQQAIRPPESKTAHFSSSSALGSSSVTECRFGPHCVYFRPSSRRRISFSVLEMNFRVQSSSDVNPLLSLLPQSL